MKRKQLQSLVAVACIFAIGGCTVGPDYVQPEFRSVPDTWKTVATQGLDQGE